MKKTAFLLLFSLCVSTLCPATADAVDLFNPKFSDVKRGPYKALIIGINYRDLVYPENDAAELAAVLKTQYGFDAITLLTGAENTTKEKLIRAFDTLAKESAKDESLLIYYSGHGSLDKTKKDGWWIPSDARPSDKETWISNKWLRGRIAEMNARHVLLVADACYAGTIYDFPQLRGHEITDKFYRTMYNNQSRIALTSAGSREQASDKGHGQNSVFATHLLDALRANRKPYLCIQELYLQFAPLVSGQLSQTPRCGELKYAGHGGGQFVFAASPVEAGNDAGTGRALLIGINDYTHSGFPSLDGPGNDVELIRGVLRSRFEFDDQHITILKNENATHTRIEQAFADLAKRAGPGDSVYIHYSGHGSYTPNRHPYEPESFDQTWVPYASRSADKSINPKDNYDILDDEIHEWLLTLLDRTKQVVFVSDSCHSASVCRGKDAPKVRAIPLDKRLHPMAKHSFSKRKPSGGIFIGAAMDDESAGEFRAENNKNYGMFTWFWAQAMQQARPGETWNDIFNRMHRKVTDQQRSQHPQIKGPRNLPVFGGKFRPVPPRIPVIRVADDGKTAVIEGGSLSGITRGSVFRKYDPKAENRDHLAKLTITDVTPFESTAAVDGITRRDDLVVEESHAYELKPIPVFLNADFPLNNDKELLHQLKTLFDEKKLPEFKRVQNQGDAEMVLYVLRPQKKNNEYFRADRLDTLPRSFPDQPPEVWILADTEQLVNDRLKIPFTDPADGMAQLKKNLKKIARIREIRKLASGSPPKIEFQTVVWEPADACKPGDPDCLPLPDGETFYKKQGMYTSSEMAGRTIDSDTLLTFVLKNRSSTSYYAYFIDITPGGEILAIYPTAENSRQDALIGPSEERDYSKITALLIDEPGEETIKLIVTEQPVDVALLESEGYERGEKRKKRNKMNPLEKLLSDAMDGTRGSRIQMRREQWGTMQYVFTVGKK